MGLNSFVPFVCSILLLWNGLSLSSERIFSLYERKHIVQQKMISQKFISESFRMTCNGQGFESLNQWQITCRDLWNLDYIGWTKAESFMDVPESDKGNLYFCQWTGPWGQCCVYERGIENDY